MKKIEAGFDELKQQVQLLIEQNNKRNASLLYCSFFAQYLYLIFFLHFNLTTQTKLTLYFCQVSFFFLRENMFEKNMFLNFLYIFLRAA